MTMTTKSATHKDANGGNALAFQHRHYAFVAKVINDAFGNGYQITDSDLITAFVNAFAANPRFDRARFLRACGVTE